MDGDGARGTASEERVPTRGCARGGIRRSFFTVINAARLYGIDPSIALHRANENSPALPPRRSEHERGSLAMSPEHMEQMVPLERSKAGGAPMRALSQRSSSAVYPNRLFLEYGCSSFSEKVARARRTFNIFNLFNLFSFVFVSGSIITLFALRMGASNSIIGLLNALLHHILHAALGKAWCAILDHKGIRLGLGHPLYCTCPILFAPCSRRSARWGWRSSCSYSKRRASISPAASRCRQQPRARPALHRRRR